MCTPDWEVGALGAAFFIGWATSLLWLPRLADNFGRQKLFAIGMTLNLVAYTVLLTAHDVRVMGAAIFSQGFITSIRLNVGFLLFMEMMPMHAQTCFGVAYGVLDALVYLFATVYFMKMS